MVAVAKDLARLNKKTVVHFSQGPERLVMGSSFDLSSRQFNETVEMPDVAVLEQRIGHHREKRGRQRHGDPEIHTVPCQMFESLNQRDVGFSDRLVKPLLFQKTLMFGMADIRQVRMKNYRKITFFHKRGFRD